MSKQTLVDELTASRRELYTALHDLSEPALAAPNAVGGYSIAGVCGLISAWENCLLTIMQQISQGDACNMQQASVAGVEGAFYADALFDNAVFNTTQVRRRQQWPWRDVLNELVWMREETGWTLANMPEPVLFTSHPVETNARGLIQLCPADIVRQLITQDRLRAAEIRAWRQEHAGT